MSNFKVIIAGAGPVGLVAAHALSKAGIDYVVLEGHANVVRDVGASLVLMPESMRVFSQFGLLDKLRELGHEVQRWADYTEKGLYLEGRPGEFLISDVGSFSYIYHRAELIQLIYDGLSPEDLARIHVNKRLSDIQETDSGVVVTCTDGSTYEGSIVIGADGVHSKAQAIMRELALKANPDADVNEEKPFPVEYKTMWCNFPRRWEFAPGDHCITHGSVSSLQLINANNRAWVFVYEKLDKPTKERVKYTEADLEAFAAKHGELPLGDRLKLKDVVKERKSGGMANLEEGILKHWSAGRIVLVGDACHKFTPNAGLGLNNGIQDVVVLVNELHRARQAAGPATPPGRAELTTAFTRYQEARKEFVEQDYTMSAMTTRMHAWPNTLYWLFDQYIMPYIPYANKLLLTKVVTPKSSRSYCLDFVEGEEPFQGKLPWLHPMKSSVAAK